MKKISIYNSDIKDNPNKREYIANKLRQSGFHTTRDGDLLIVIGGDGTFLSAIKKRLNQNPIFVGFNAGNLGFFSEFTIEKIDEFIKVLKKEQYWIEEFPLYEIHYKDDGESKIEYFINDLVIERNSSRVLHMGLKKNDKTLCDVDGDGVIISSSLGSTGYNLSAGGPILTRKEKMVITPICPLPVTEAYQSIQESIIINNKDELTIFPNIKKQRKFRIVCDGREIRTRQPRYIEIKRSEKTIRILRSNKFKTIENIENKILKFQ